MIDKEFSLNRKIIIVTGGAGFLGQQHLEAVIEAGGVGVIWDLHKEKIDAVVKKFNLKKEGSCFGYVVDVTNKESVKEALDKVESEVGEVHVLINNAAVDPKVNDGLDQSWSRLENYTLDNWYREIGVGLTGAFLCSQVVGKRMAERGFGSIVNIASDLSIIAPDQRIYQKSNLDADKQPVKPVTYSVIKHGLIGLTKYLATYWAKSNVRVNALSPAGVFGNEPEDFVNKLTNLIPMGRMAQYGEYQAAIIFLCSSASKYMTGQNLVIDGGRSCW